MSRGNFKITQQNSDVDVLNTKLKNKTWETADVNKTDFTDLEIGSISPATAKSIGITNATDYFQVIRIPWTYPYPNQLLLALSGKQKMYYRACSNGKWETPKQLLTNADLDGVLATTTSGATAIEAGLGDTRYRLQINPSGNVVLYQSTDGGNSWPNTKNVFSFN